MGSSASKHERSTALLLCKDQLRYIKQAIESRYALSAAQMAYEQSLRNVGIALRQLVESEASVESSLSASEPGKSPSRSSYASLSPWPLLEHASLPFDGGSPLESHCSNVSYMRSTVSTSLKVTVDATKTNFTQEEQQPISPILPPPLPPHLDSSWDFFDPNDHTFDNVATKSREHCPDIHLRTLEDLKHSNEGVLGSASSERGDQNGSYSKLHHSSVDEIKTAHAYLANGASSDVLADLIQKQVAEVGGLDSRPVSTNEENAASSKCRRSKSEKVDLQKELCSEREGASDLITHRAKDLLSSVREIEHRFTRAAESCHEVSRMLETRKIRLNISSEAIGKSSDALFLSAVLICFKARNVASHESDQHVAKVITWNRSVSSQSSSSRTPLVSAAKDDLAESGSDFIEEFCMISGSHSSTLDRVYAWERKLYDELKACESIRKAYDQKCIQLRHQFARDLDARRIDKTRAVVKDLHSRLTVATQALHSISQRIEKLRDDELLPQLVELIQGFMRMWRIMLETHHAQQIIISLAYPMKISSMSVASESYNHALMNFKSETDCFSSSFSNWVDAHKCYVDALHCWLQKCILQPQEQRSRGRKLAFSPRRALAPAIFVLLRDWSTGIASLPSQEARDSIRRLVMDVHEIFKHQAQDKPTKKKPADAAIETRLDLESKEAENSETDSKVASLQASLAAMFDRLSKFSEAMIKLYENVKQESENARSAYTDVRIR